MKAQAQGPWPALALAVVALAGALYFAQLGAMPLSDRDEGEYAAAVAAMAQRGDYVIPHLNGQPYLEKPILLFWAMTATNWLAGPGEWAARLPSALSAFLVVLAVGYLVWRVSGSLAAATLSAAACAFMPLNALVGRACLTDMPLTLFTTLALGGFFLASETPPPKDRPWYLAAWLGLGLAFLTKGPVAPAVVLPICLTYALCQGRLWPILKRAQIHWGLLILVVVNLPWYGLAFWRLGDKFWQAFFVSQNLRRFSEVLLGHGGGYFYYLPVLLLGGYAFSVAALPALGSALAKNSRAARAADPLARLRLFAAIAVLVVLVVFTLAATKQINYVQPAMPFVAVLAGYHLWRLGAGEPGGRLARGVFWGGLYGLGGLFLAVFLALPAGLPLAWDKIQASIRPDSSEYALPEAVPALWLWPLVAALVLAGTLMGARLLVRGGRAKLLGPALALGGALLCGVMMLGLLPQGSALVQDPARQMAHEIRERGAGQAAVITFGLWKPSLLFYLDREIPRLRHKEQEELARRLAEREPLLVMTRVSLLPRLKEVPGFLEVARYQGYLLGGNGGGHELWGRRINREGAEQGGRP
ncbi:MAG: glycosyltransferase family 39 protein [Desulfarculus sp.]|nr:glycosyltransferase family 39 protein [Desulfarculus sp.]